MNKLFSISLLCLCVASCGSNKSGLQAELSAEQRLKMPNKIEAYTAAIQILEDSSIKRNNKLLYKYCYELGVHQEVLYSSANEDALKSFKKSMDYGLKCQQDSDTSFAFLPTIAYIRCLIRKNSNSLFEAKQLIDSLTLIKRKLKGQGAELTALQLAHVEVDFKYQLRGQDADQRAVRKIRTGKLIDIYNNAQKNWLKSLEDLAKELEKAKEGTNDIYKINDYYAGMLYWMLSKRVQDKDYLNKARLRFEKAEANFQKVQDEKVIKSEMFHTLGNFYIEMGDFAKAQSCFSNGEGRNIGNLFYEADWITGLLKPIETKLEYNSFNNLQINSLDTLQDAKNRLKKLVQLKNMPEIERAAYLWLYWIAAVTQDSEAIAVPNFMKMATDYEANYYLGLYLMHKNRNDAKIAWKTASSDDGRIGAMSHFWLGHFAQNESEKETHFDEALRKTQFQGRSIYQDALYERGLLTLNRQIARQKKYKEIEDFNAVLRLNPNYFAAREKRGYIYLKLNKEKEAIADFNYIFRHASDSVKLKGLIGEGLIHAENITLRNFKIDKDLDKNRYNANTFLESYFYLQQHDEDDFVFSRYDYFQLHLNAFKTDPNIHPILISSLDEKKIKPRITWHISPYTPVGDTTRWSWFVKNDKKVNPIPFSVSKSNIFKNVEIYFNNQLICYMTHEDSLKTAHFEVEIPAELIQLDTAASLRIVGNLQKKHKKLGVQGVIESEKSIYFQTAHEFNADKKVAFIIQNTNYLSSDYKLDKKTYDESETLAHLLKSHGFEIQNGKPYRDLNEVQFHKMLDEDYAAAVKKYNVVLFYYTGHGLSSNGKNYLLPTDTQADDSLTISTQIIYEKIHALVATSGQDVSDLENKAFIYIFDACRNLNEAAPVVNTVQKDDLMAHSVVVHTTRQGEFVKEGDNGKTLFMTHFPKNFKKGKEMDILQLLDIRKYLDNDTYQIPEVASNLGFQIFILK